MHDDGLFREEALRRFREGGTRGQVLRLGARWTSVAFLLLMVATVLGLACLFLIKVPVAIHGPAAVVEKDRVLALLPEAGRADVGRERYLLWRKPGTDAPLRIERIEPRSVSREEAGALAGSVFAGRPLPETSLVVWATPVPGAAVQGSGTVSLREERIRLAELFWTGGR